MVKKQIKKEKMKVIFKRAKGISEEECQKRLDVIFYFLFTEMLKDKSNEKFFKSMSKVSIM